MLSILYLSVIITLSCSNKEKIYSFYIERAYKALKEQKLQEAFSNSNAAVKIDTQKPIGFILRGRSLFEMDSILSAKADFIQALSLDSDNTTSLFYLGMISYDVDEYETAIDYFNKAISTKGSDSLYFEFNNNFSKYAYEDNISMASLRFFRGVSYYYNGNYPHALDDFTFASNENFNIERCFFYIGMIALEKGDARLACKYLLLAIKHGYKEGVKYLPNNCE